MPKVSIILTSFNHEKYIAEAVDSVLNQTFTDFELMICDDGSVDNSQAIIKSYDDMRIKLFLYEKNIGPHLIAKEATNTAQGEYIAIHHSDDIWESTKLEKQVIFLDTHPEYAACFTQVKFIDESSEIYNLPDGHQYKNVFKQKNRTREEWLNHFFWKMNCLCNPSALCRNDKSIIVQDACLFQLPDYFMWLNVLLKRNVYVLEEELTRFRLRRGKQNSMSSWSQEKIIRTTNETYYAIKPFLTLLNDSEYFLKVFPEAEEYRIDNEIVTEFAFAQLCLQNQSPAYQKLGLEILYDLLHNSTQAANVKRIYDYDNRNFVADTGRYDLYGINFQLPKLHTFLYIDYGNGFNDNDAITCEVLIRARGEFFVQFDCKLDKPVKRLRFDPEGRGMLIMRLTNILINNEQVTNYSDNALQVVDGYHEFLGVDPAFFINHSVTDSELNVQITGFVDQSRIPKFERTLKLGVNSYTWKLIKPLSKFVEFVKNIVR